jgi:hypothetical protein
VVEKVIIQGLATPESAPKRHRLPLSVSFSFRQYLIVKLLSVSPLSPPPLPATSSTHQVYTLLPLQPGVQVLMEILQSVCSDPLWFQNASLTSFCPVRQA